ECTDAADLSFRLVTANVYRPGRFTIEPTSKETVSPLTAAVAMTRPATGRLFQEVPVSSQSPDSVRSSTVRGRLSGRSKVSSTRALVMRGVERGTANARKASVFHSGQTEAVSFRWSPNPAPGISRTT